jgi:hypothetical protein
VSVVRVGSLLAALALSASAAAYPLPSKSANAPRSNLGPNPWADLAAARLPAQSDLGLLRRYERPWVERQGEWHRFLVGRFGSSTWTAAPRLSWTVNAWEPAARPTFDASADAMALEMTPMREVSAPPIATAELLPSWLLGQPPQADAAFLSLASEARCQPWQRAYTVTLARYGDEHDTIRLLECDGSVALDAVDRLSVLARPTGTARPELPLPLEPLAESEALGEWVPNVRLLDPRLIWVLARLSEAFPGRAIYLISGYRRDGHESFHRKGRALDLFVMGVKNEAVMRVCRKLRDVGCGFYPHNKFLHVDVRPPGTGHAVWVDVSEPGRPSRFVDSWPGVVESGALNWGNGE